MIATARTEPSISDRELVVERVYDAPRDLVWETWTDPKHLDRWWGPNGFRNETHSMDLRAGGSWRYTMHGPDGKDWVNWIRYEEISRPDRLVYDHGGETDEPLFHVTVTFSAQGKRTRVSMRSVWPTAEALAAVMKYGVVEGGRQTMARLAGLLPHLADRSAEGSVVISRLLDAPPSLVFAAWSTPEGLARWWGPKDFTLPTCEMDFRSGGAYRMVMRGPDGAEVQVHGRYREIVPDQRIVFDAVVDAGGRPIDVTTTVTFAEDDGKTLLTVRQTIPADEEAARSQLEGWNSTLEKLGAALQRS